jgi:outer membrane protein assembly factor BamE (lipoprotein component of BamABCDE complex)
MGTKMEGGGGTDCGCVIKRRPAMKLIVPLLVILLLVGCASSPKQKVADRSTVDQIIEGTSTKSDVIALLGPPDSRSERTNGEIWTYSISQDKNDFKSHAASFLFGRMPTTNYVLILGFSSDGILRGKELDTSNSSRRLGER